MSHPGHHAMDGPKNGRHAAGSMPAEFKALFSAEIEKWAKVIKAAKVTAG